MPSCDNHRMAKADEGRAAAVVPDPRRRDRPARTVGDIPPLDRPATATIRRGSKSPLGLRLWNLVGHTPIIKRSGVAMAATEPGLSL